MAGVKVPGMLRRCSSCSAGIFWLATAKGNRIPIDAVPVADGNLFIDEQSGRALFVSQETPAPEQLRWRSHFATCPNAKQHRKANR